MTGRLLLVPATLDFGIAGEPGPIDELLPRATLRSAAATTHWIVENAKSARAFLKRVHAVMPPAAPMRALSIVELPRPATKAGQAAAAARSFDAKALLAPATHGHDIGLLCEAGLPAIADAGTGIVAAAHAIGVVVVVLPGASALSLAVAASGLDGQRFAFVGYLPVNAGERSARLRELEAGSRRDACTQVAIETPYRNRALLGTMLVSLHASTRVSVSVGLTTPAGWTRTDSVAGWRQAEVKIPEDVPAVFSFLAQRGDGA